MKSELTLQLEREIWNATRKSGVFGCFEVTIGFFGVERVDYLTYDTKGTWRCYEIKASKSDFYSSAKKTFVGHYNYYVMPASLFEEVKDDIPEHIGVYAGRKCVKKAKRQPLGVDEQVLKDSLIRSLHRVYEDYVLGKDPNVVRRLRKQLEKERRERERYRTMYWEMLTTVASERGIQEAMSYTI